MFEQPAASPRPPYTVYPSRAGAFPPATFFDAASELAYIHHVQAQYRGTFGICVCPSASFWVHQPDVAQQS
jgi:hypothetical protein